MAYVTLAGAGLIVFEIPGRRALRTLAPPLPAESTDDLAVADGLLFALDAAPPGYLTVYSLSVPLSPALVAGPIEVPAGPYTGVSAAAGRVIVSGGTSQLSVRSYDASGSLGTDVGTIDLGTGQPDVLLSPQANFAVVSTHFQLSDFGITLIQPGPPPVGRGTLELKGAGFTAGGATPGNFPIESALDVDQLLVASGGGLASIDVSNLDAPRLISVTPLPVLGVNVDARDRVAAVVGSDPTPTLVLLDVSNRQAPVIQQTLALPAGSRVTGVALTPTHIVATAHENGVLVFDR